MKDSDLRKALILTLLENGETHFYSIYQKLHDEYKIPITGGEVTVELTIMNISDYISIEINKPHPRTFYIKEPGRKFLSDYRKQMRLIADSVPSLFACS